MEAIAFVMCTVMYILVFPVNSLILIKHVEAGWLSLWGQRSNLNRPQRLATSSPASTAQSVSVTAFPRRLDMTFPKSYATKA